MKKIYLIMLIAVLAAVGVHIALEYGGYHKIPVEGGTLYGRAMGKDKDLVVLLVAGSGPTDMDGNSTLITGRNDSLLLLARGLAREGISTFRYDKRTAGKSAKTFDLDVQMEFDTFVRDCVAVINYLKQQGYKRVVVAGHSKGSLVGMLAAGEAPVTGFISLAGTGLPIDVTLEKQLLAQLPADSLELQVLRGLREGKIDTSLPQDHMFSPSQQAFLLSWMAYDPGALIAKLAIPTLVVHGDADIQVDMADYQALQAGVGVEASRIIPGMNHVFKEINDPGDQMASYSDPSYPLHRQLIPALVEFLLDPSYRLICSSHLQQKRSNEDHTRQ
jgi:uncharacterized protein